MWIGLLPRIVLLCGGLGVAHCMQCESAISLEKKTKVSTAAKDIWCLEECCVGRVKDRALNGAQLSPSLELPSSCSQ